MTFQLKTLFAISLIASLLCTITGMASGTVYKYRKDGVWHFTDDPTDVPSADLAPAAGSGAPSSDTATDLKQRLIQHFDPDGPIEIAILSTVIIETSFGYGTGFFITADGYIVTNRHVIRTMENTDTAGDAMAARAEALGRYEERIQAEEARLARAMDNLTAFRRHIEGQEASSGRQYDETRYREGMQRYRQWKEEVDGYRRKLESEQAALSAARIEQRYSASIAGLNRHFTVYAADNTTLYAYVAEISDDHDLALLKVDGVVTPFLETADPRASAHGDPVYAVGNPVKLRNSVASGVVSGFEGPFVKTDAKIYPGNSGGPLVTAAGRVIGVNTFKRLTHKFEGLGFAISITVVRDAFDAI